MGFLGVSKVIVIVLVYEKLFKKIMVVIVI